MDGFKLVAAKTTGGLVQGFRCVMPYEDSAPIIMILDLEPCTLTFVYEKRSALPLALTGFAATKK